MLPSLMSTSLAIVLAAVICTLAWGVLIAGRLPGPYRTRACQGRAWRRRFPAASKQQIREFLSAFVEAFAFSAGQRLRFSPNDRIIDIYRAMYPSRWMPDGLELEMLAVRMQAHYGLALAELWSEQLTLGDLFAHSSRGIRPAQQ
jgi:hypothetical protein